MAYVLDGPNCNPYGKPVEDLVAVLDRNTGEVLEVQDSEVGAGLAAVTRPWRWPQRDRVRRGHRARRAPSHGDLNATRSLVMAFTQMSATCWSTSPHWALAPA